MKKAPLSQPLEDWLKKQVLRQDAGALKPIPATRVLGERFGISHGTVFRLLCKMEKDGSVWRHANGRFYPALAGRVLGRAKPLAVMLRRMRSWSSLCQEVMEGFTDECGERDRPILWFHNRDLVVEQSPNNVRVASVHVQRKMLQEFNLFHGDTIGGVLFDETWRDAALRNTFATPPPMISFNRPSFLPGIGSVTPDFRAGALLALSHLLACDYKKILLIDPLPDYEASKVSIEAVKEVYREIAGHELPHNQVAVMHTDSDRRQIIRRLAASKTRTGLICPEDNQSLALAEALRLASLPMGKVYGLVSVMGTSAMDSSDVTCVRFDYREMGKIAASSLCEGVSKSCTLPPRLDVRASTVGLGN